MSLLTLPAELRLRIYDYLPQLTRSEHQEIWLNTELTPPICCVNSILRRETLPIYATNSTFAISMDDSPQKWKSRIDCLILALGPAMSRVGCLKLSRHWRILQPQRNQRHVGFYIRIDSFGRESPSLDTAFVSTHGTPVESPVVASRGLKVITGTYPLYVNDYLTKSLIIFVESEHTDIGKGERSTSHAIRKY